MKESLIPILRARISEAAGVKTWEVWCPYCLRYHTHGAVAGHRVAHCDSLCGVCRITHVQGLECEHDQPFKDSGYFIAMTDAEVRLCARLAKRQERETIAGAKKGRREQWVV